MSYFLIIFFLNDSIFFFCSLSLFTEHFHRARIYARSLYASLESYKCTYYTVKTNPLSSGNIFCFAYRMTSSRSILDQRRRRTVTILLLLPFFSRIKSVLLFTNYEIWIHVIMECKLNEISLIRRNGIFYWMVSNTACLR